MWRRTRAQPEDDQAGAVVSVRRQAVQNGAFGLVCSLTLLAVVLAVGHGNWHLVLGSFGIAEAVAGLRATVRAVRRLRDRLREAELLPHEAVEKLPESSAIRGTVVLLVYVVFVLTLSPLTHWILAVAATTAALFAAEGAVKPFAEAFIVRRWEREHGRVFRRVGAIKEDEAELYVAGHPVPAA